MNKNYKPINWTKPTSDLAETVWSMQWSLMWHPEEIAVSKDLKQWKNFEHQDTYKKVFAGLTLLDTIQTNIGMNEIAKYNNDLQEKALLSVFGAFEAIHAKSYSYIFTTLCTNNEIEDLFKWAENNDFLQYKANKIAEIYGSIKQNDNESLWKAKFASVMLESFLFYSGFFFPLYQGGQGNLRNSAEVISLIIRDESLHGTTIGYFAQNIFNNLSKEKQEELKKWGYALLIDLYKNEVLYTKDLYAETGLVPEVLKYVRYNANKALMNLGLDTMFPEEEVNPIVMNGIRNEGSTYDFFSQKGSTYTIAKVKEITEKTFDFSDIY